MVSLCGPIFSALLDLGATGTIALRAVMEHPHMTLAGVYVHGQEKVGRDTGELHGMAPMNVTATDSIDKIVELGADVPPRSGESRPRRHGPDLPDVRSYAVIIAGPMPGSTPTAVPSSTRCPYRGWARSISATRCCSLPPTRRATSPASHSRSTRAA